MNKLTRERAIKEHRRMWLWLAQTILNNRAKPWDAGEYYRLHQRDVFRDTGIIKVKTAGDFVCQYQWQTYSKPSKPMNEPCKTCPLDWGEDFDEFYGKCAFVCEPIQKYSNCKHDEWEKAAQYAYEIAMLPERKIDEEK